MNSMHQFVIYSVFSILQSVFSKTTEKPSGDSDKPQFLRFVIDDIACQFHAPYDHRCRQVFINYKEIEGYNKRVFMFDLGMLRFYVHEHRIYYFNEYAMADYNVSF